MKVIRKGVFETNSSSTHSIYVAEGEFDCATLFVDNDNICYVYPAEFGWEYRHYNDAPTKASYCLTYAWNNDLTQHLDMLREVIMENTKAQEVRFAECDSKYYPKGYIDHQSDRGDYDACGPAFANKESLKAFIFNSESLLLTSNDNE